VDDRAGKTPGGFYALNPFGNLAAPQATQFNAVSNTAFEPEIVVHIKNFNIPR
jgi:hypothetical protein